MLSPGSQVCPPPALGLCSLPCWEGAAHDPLPFCSAPYSPEVTLLVSEEKAFLCSPYTRNHLCSLCHLQASTCGPAAANAVLRVVHKSWVVTVLPAPANPLFPRGSSGQLPPEVTTGHWERIMSPPTLGQFLECLHHGTTPGLATLFCVKIQQASWRTTVTA